MRNSLAILLLLCSIFFWHYARIFNLTFFNLVNLGSLLLMAISFFQVNQNKGLRFKNAIIIMMVGIVLNILSAYFNNGQSISVTFLSFGPTYFILLYFFAHEYEIEVKYLENTIIVFAILYSVFYLIQDSAFPRIIFNAQMYMDRGTLRIRLPGGGFLMLGYFLVLNRYMLKHNILYVILALFFFIVLLKGGFRSMTVAAILMSGVMMIKLVKYSVINYVLIVLAMVLFVGLLQLEVTSNIVDQMLNVTTENREQGEDYIRKKSRDYYTKTYPENISYYIVGGGLPSSSAYGNYMAYLQREYGFFWSDLGLIGYFFIVGMIATLGLLIFVFKAIFIKLPPDKLYLNIFFAYLLLTSYTTIEIARTGMFGVEALALYLIDRALDGNKILSNNTVEKIE